MRIRRASARDADTVAALFLETRRHSMAYLPVIRTVDETRRWMAETIFCDFDVWVAERGPEIAAFLALAGRHVEYLYVRPSHQRLGIGDMLLTKAKRLSPEGLELLVFAENTPAQAFYRARGFHCVAELVIPEEEGSGYQFVWTPEGAPNKAR
ncbi:MAG: GNAT family N-acetyltransferase [Rhodospirillales bacterium]|nr:GNAT family N-acetyltransferase [Rhodospirillales bacterium]